MAVEDYESDLAECAEDMGQTKLARSSLIWEILYEPTLVIKTFLSVFGQ